MPSNRKRRDYAAEYRRRQQLAQMRGYKGYWQQRTGPRSLSGDELWSAPEKVRWARGDALSVVERARETGVSVEEAARLRGVRMEVVRFFADEALGKTRGRRTLPKSSDRLKRLRPIYLEGETRSRFVVAEGSREADRLSRAFTTQWDYLHGQASRDDLRRLEGMRAGGRRVESDPDRFQLIGALGEPNPDEVYRELVS
jgi:hypothetical protein